MPPLLDDLVVSEEVPFEFRLLLEVVPLEVVECEGDMVIGDDVLFFQFGRCCRTIVDQRLVTSRSRKSHQSSIIVHCLHVRHHHRIVGVILDVFHLCGDVAVSKDDGADAILEEIALIFKCAECQLLDFDEKGRDAGTNDDMVRYRS